MVKDFTPARGNTWTGVSIKSPVLERPKVAQYQPIFTQTNELSFTPESASLVPIYDPYYYYLAGDKADYYEGNIPGSTLDTYLVFQENNRNPFLVDNTIGFIPPGFISGNTDFVLNYDSPRPENFFLNSDFNVLQNNIDISLTSEYRKKLTPILSVDNLGRCFTSYSISESVELQDSYLSLTAYTRPRYDGVQLYSRFFNRWTQGDNSYGQSPVINYNVKKLGLFTEVVPNRYLPYKSNVSLKYLVNESGSLTELNLRNRNWEEVQNTFETGDTLNVSLFDAQKFSNQVQTNGNKIIVESGYSYFPVFYAYGDEINSNPALSASWTSSAIFNAPTGESQNLLNRFFTINMSSGSIIPGGTTYFSSSYTAAGTNNMHEVWNLFNVTSSNTNLGNFFYTGSGPGNTTSQLTSSYYVIPAEGSYDFFYNFTTSITTSTPPATAFTASMELWVSNSSGINLIDKNALSSSYAGNPFYVAELANIPYYSAYQLQYVQSTTLLAGYDIYEYIQGNPNPYNITTLLNDTQFDLYEVYATVGPEQNQYTIIIGYYWTSGTPNTNNINGVTWYSVLNDIPQVGVGGNSYNFRRTVNVNTTGSINPGDKIEFRFFVDSDGAGISNVDLIPGGVLKATATNNALFADNATVCVDQTANAFYLNSSLSPYYNSLNFFNPLDAKVSASYATLYDEYGDIFYPFFLEANDKIVIQASGSSGPILEYTVAGSSLQGGTGFSYISIQEDIAGYFGDLICGQYYKILFLKRIPDETSIILEFPKPAGKTSYGFVIPQNISQEVLNNIDQITTNVNQQLIDVGVGVTS
jgi:hypothetical protein